MKPVGDWIAGFTRKWQNSVSFKVRGLSSSRGQSVRHVVKAKPMRTLAGFASLAVLGTCLLDPLMAPAAAPDHPQNWAPPATKIYAQKLADEIMATHHELISVTFPGVPPGQTDVYTIFAHSSPDRIGNADDPDDIDISKN